MALAFSFLTGLDFNPEMLETGFIKKKSTLKLVQMTYTLNCETPTESLWLGSCAKGCHKPWHRSPVPDGYPPLSTSQLLQSSR